MRRTIRRSLFAAAAAAALLLSAGCSLIPGLGGGGAEAPPAPPPASSNASSSQATGSPAATTTPAVSKTTSGTAIPVPSVPAVPAARISSDIDGVELRELQAKGALVVDLRPEEEFEKEHIKKAENVPMADFAERAAGWSRSRTVVLYDKSGVVGQSAQTWMEKQGFTRIYHLFRGIEGYDDELAGTDPKPIPPKRPVLYFFTADPDDLGPGTPTFNAKMDAIEAGERLMKELRAEYGADVEYHEYSISNISGLSAFIEFEGTAVPMFRLVTHEGRSEQYTGVGTFETVRSHVAKSVAEYRADTQP